jgi:hypothetical protein
MRATFLGRMCFAEAARRDRREAPVNPHELVKRACGEPGPIGLLRFGAAPRSLRFGYA